MKWHTDDADVTDTRGFFCHRPACGRQVTQIYTDYTDLAGTLELYGLNPF